MGRLASLSTVRLQTEEPTDGEGELLSPVRDTQTCSQYLPAREGHSVWRMHSPQQPEADFKTAPGVTSGGVTGLLCHSRLLQSLLAPPPLGQATEALASRSKSAWWEAPSHTCFKP